jgi:hypothetical protein
MDPSTIIARFQPISLAEMDGVKLQDRVDTKYVLSEAQLPELLEAMVPHYRILEVEGIRGTAYRSLYLDTPDHQHYRDHHNRRTFRCKVRFREYVGSGLAFLEVKRKTGRGRTDKARLRVPSIPGLLSPDQRAFIAEASKRNEDLVPVLWNRFTRYTFVAREGTERLTLDTGLTFSSAKGESVLEGIVVVELKQPRADHLSPFVRLMRTRGIRPAGMSKYCIGMIANDEAVKRNAFKEILLMLQRLQQAA